MYSERKNIVWWPTDQSYNLNTVMLL